MNTTPLNTEREQAEVRGLPSPQDAIGEQFEQLDRQIRALVHERPLVTVAVAVGVGFVLGRLLRG